MPTTPKLPKVERIDLEATRENTLEIGVLYDHNAEPTDEIFISAKQKDGTEIIVPIEIDEVDTLIQAIAHCCNVAILSRHGTFTAPKNYRTKRTTHKTKAH